MFMNAQVQYAVCDFNHENKETFPREINFENVTFGLCTKTFDLEVTPSDDITQTNIHVF